MINPSIEGVNGLMAEIYIYMNMVNEGADWAVDSARDDLETCVLMRLD